MRVIEVSNKVEKKDEPKQKITTTYVYGTGIDEVLSMTRNGIAYYYHENALGSVVAVTDNAGAVAERYEYDAYGKVSIYDADYNPRTASEIGNTYMFTGREYEQETGLYYYRARHYSPEHGRFLQRDPIGIWEDEVNLGNGYSYVGNNPVNRMDPFGLKEKQEEVKCDNVGLNWCVSACGGAAGFVYVYGGATPAAALAALVTFGGCSWFCVCEFCRRGWTDTVCFRWSIQRPRDTGNCSR